MSQSAKAACSRSDSSAKKPAAGAATPSARDGEAVLRHRSRRDSVGRNIATLEGEISTPVEIRELPSGTHLATLFVRVPGPGTKRTSIPVTVWDPDESLGDFIEGQPVTVEGKVLRRFLAAPDGGRRSRVEVVADSVASPA